MSSLFNKASARLIRVGFALLVAVVLLGACGGSGGDSLVDSERSELRGWWHAVVAGSTFEVGFFAGDLGQARRWRKRADGRYDQQSSDFYYAARPEGRVILAEEEILTDDCPVRLLPSQCRYRRDGRQLTLTDEITGEVLTLTEGKVDRGGSSRQVQGCWNGTAFTPLK